MLLYVVLLIIIIYMLWSNYFGSNCPYPTPRPRPHPRPTPPSGPETYLAANNYYFTDNNRNVTATTDGFSSSMDSHSIIVLIQSLYQALDYNKIVVVEEIIYK